MELVVVILIVGILTGIAVPAYYKVTERRYWRQAQDLLNAIYAGERVYYFANAKYLAIPPALWQAIHMDAPGPAIFKVETPTAITFTAEARSSSNPTQWMTINQNHALDTTNWPMP
jgi:Tfp pilus assembly protein PilE